MRPTFAAFVVASLVLVLAASASAPDAVSFGKKKVIATIACKGVDSLELEPFGAFNKGLTLGTVLDMTLESGSEQLGSPMRSFAVPQEFTVRQPQADSTLVGHSVGFAMSFQGETVVPVVKAQFESSIRDSTYLIMTRASIVSLTSVDDLIKTDSALHRILIEGITTPQGHTYGVVRSVTESDKFEFETAHADSVRAGVSIKTIGDFEFHVTYSCNNEFKQFGHANPMFARVSQLGRNGNVILPVAGKVIKLSKIRIQGVR